MAYVDQAPRNQGYAPQYPPPYYPHNGNGRADLSKSYIPSLLVIGLVTAGIAGAWTAANVYRDNQDTQKTLGQRIDGVERRLDDQGRTLTSIDVTLKKIERGSGWGAEVRR